MARAMQISTRRVVTALLSSVVLTVVLTLVISLMASAGRISVAYADDIASGEWGTCSWVIDEDGKLTIAPKSGTEGTLPDFKPDTSEGFFSGSNAPWASYGMDVTSVEVKSKVKAGASVAGMFSDCLQASSIDVSGLDTQSTKDMSYMFMNCHGITTLDVKGLNTAAATNMRGMFSGCTALKSLDLSKFNTGNVTDMSDMFGRCGVKDLDLSSFNTSKVTTMGAMFDMAQVQKLNLSSFTTSSKTNMTAMFEACISLEEVTLGKNFVFNDDGREACYLPEPVSDYISGASGFWYSQSGDMYNPDEVPSNVAATYYAVAPISSGDSNPVALSDSVYNQRQLYAGSVTQYSFTLSKDDIVAFAFFPSTSVQSCDIWLYDESGNWLDRIALRGEHHAKWSLPSGNYKLEVKAEQDVTLEIIYDCRGVDTSKYQIISSNNRVRDDALPIELNKTIMGVFYCGYMLINDGGYIDGHWYTFDLAQKSDVDLKLKTASDAYLTVYDKDGKKVKGSNGEDMVAKSSSSAVAALKGKLSAGKYYVEVISESSANWGETFMLDVNATPVKEESTNNASESKVPVAVSGTWKKSGGKWWYSYDAKTKAAEGKAYPANEWQQIDGAWYHFDKSGYAQTGWQKIGKKWYLFSKGGAMKTGWQKSGGSWYYLDKKSGAMKTGWLKDGKSWYYFGKDGAMKTGWQKSGKKWYYFNKSGAMATKKWVDNCYLQKDGSMATSKWIGKYHVNASGFWDKTK